MTPFPSNALDVELTSEPGPTLREIRRTAYERQQRRESILEELHGQLDNSPFALHLVDLRRVFPNASIRELNLLHQATLERLADEALEQ